MLLTFLFFCDVTALCFKEQQKHKNEKADRCDPRLQKGPQLDLLKREILVVPVTSVHIHTPVLFTIPMCVVGSARIQVSLVFCFVIGCLFLVFCRQAGLRILTLFMRVVFFNLFLFLNCALFVIGSCFF